MTYGLKKANCTLMSAANPSEYRGLEKLIAATHGAMGDCNAIILARTESEIDLIPALAGHLIAGGGKRMRPMLTLAGALLAGGGQMQNAAKLAAAVEFIHTATLLHDDVIDASELRRGNKTASAIWGNEASVLVGDFLFARAFELMVETGKIAVLGRLAKAAARITEGEISQMLLVGNPAASVEDYTRIITAKTAELFAAAATSGVMVAGGSDALAAAMERYGMALGVAFQIADDALDYAATSDAIGKEIGDDFREGKITLPVILAWQDGDAEEREFWQKCLGGEIGGGDLDKALDLIKKHNTITRALDEARKHAEKAAAIIEKAEIAPEAQEISTALIEAARFAAMRGV